LDGVNERKWLAFSPSRGRGEGNCQVAILLSTGRGEEKKTDFSNSRKGRRKGEKRTCSNQGKEFRRLLARRKRLPGVGEGGGRTARLDVLYLIPSLIGAFELTFTLFPSEGKKEKASSSIRHSLAEARLAKKKKILFKGEKRKDYLSWHRGGGGR